jgi:hypothetical protein
MNKNVKKKGAKYIFLASKESEKAKKPLNTETAQ